MPHNYNTRNSKCTFDILLEHSTRNHIKSIPKSPKKKKVNIKDDNIININAEENLKKIIKKNILKHFLLDEFNDDDSVICDEYAEDESIYYNSLPEQKKKIIDKMENQIENLNKQDMPYRFQVLSAKLSIETKSLLINKLNQFNQLDSSDSEYFKLSKWLDTFASIPFGKYSQPAITKYDPGINIKNFLINTKNILDSVIYSHAEAKSEIIQYVCNSISNPNINGKVLAIQGPAGNGKTTLIKNGVAKALKRPFGFVALGGAQDSSFLEGFDYTYEGSKCGKIIDILKKCNCMNPIIYFDELDKISDTPKGEEISNMLCHIIDPSQNNTFYDRYLSEIEIDLSKVIFIFSFNNESLINPILKDRLKIIRTDGYNIADKINIANKFLIPECLKSLNLVDKIVFEKNSLKNIIMNFTNNEKGVRELKRNIEAICSKINLYSYLNIKQDKPEADKIDKLEATKLTKPTKPEADKADKPEADKADKPEADKADKPEADKIDKTETEIKYNIIKKKNKDDDKSLVKFKIENFKFPIMVNDDLVNNILKCKTVDESIAHIYL